MTDTCLPQNDDACLSIVSSSDVVDAHRMPSFLQWVDDDAIVICDPRGRVTLFTVMHSAITQTRQFNAFTSNVLPEVFSMVALRAADTSITLYIGEADQCTVFALREDAIRPPVLTREQELCHDHGRARQVRAAYLEFCACSSPVQARSHFTRVAHCFYALAVIPASLRTTQAAESVNIVSYKLHY